MADHSRPTAPDWEKEHLLAGFDRLYARLVAWARNAPAWPPFEEASGLVRRLEPRLKAPEIDLDRALVVGFLGGSGTGKSTLFNALLGRPVSRAGKEYRPMTRRAVVACHPSVDPRFLGLDDDDMEVHKINVPMLQQMILVDCPDPDTQDPEDGAGGVKHLDILRTVLPHCDVLVHTVTSQKYKSHVVGRELLKNAPGRQILYVQTHSKLDEDNRRDLRTYLDGLGLDVPEVFRLDAADALRNQELGEPVDAEFARFRDLLEHELASRARHRIRRANLLGLYDWLLATIRPPIDAGLDAVGRLERSMDADRAALLAKVRARMTERIDANRRLWRSRVLRALTQAWGAGPLAGLLGLWSAGGSLVRSLILLRARTPTQAMLAGGLALSQLAGEKWRERQAAGAWAAEADLGLTEADVARARSVLRGHLADAGINSPAPASTTATPRDLSAEQLADVAVAAYQKLDTEAGAIIERRVATRASRPVHVLFEAAFCLLPAYLAFHMGRNFFYEHLWNRAPLLGLDFLLQAALWCLIWGVLLGFLLLHLLNRGIVRELKGAVIRLSPADLFESLYADSAAACLSIRGHAATLDSIARELGQLKGAVGGGGVLDLGLGGLRTNGRPATTGAEAQASIDPIPPMIEPVVPASTARDRGPVKREVAT
ncbi:GTPase domain-containing protein [Aquisphaera insulae]|uniref:GTPase domain-containing protein n=1 Tax=Aquisphaera insulae TaxID=2712864 RepID=UPI0013E9CC70|nr:GTPase domain-containing protein [Aquisphaera insulae]